MQELTSLTSLDGLGLQLKPVLDRPWKPDDVDPIISTFFGIVIRMFYQDHEPPHFHADHQGQQAKFDLHGKLIAGNIRSKTALRLIQQWAVLHRTDLEANWARMKAGQTLERIAPLE